MRKLSLAAVLCIAAMPAMAQITDKMAQDAYIYGYSMEEAYKFFYGTAIKTGTPRNRFQNIRHLADDTEHPGINNDTLHLQGWLDLQRVWFDNRNDPDMMKAGIADWQKRYPQNPGAKILPTQLVNVQSFKPASTSKIALLLPLNGQAAVFGRTIQQGFEAAKNMGTQPVADPAVAAPAADTAAATTTEQPQTTDGVASPAQASVSDLTNETPAQPETPAAQPTAPAQPTTTSAPANPSAELKIYDTSSQPLNQILTQVQQDGASIVVGPLLKNNVEELMKSNTPLNVLALNQPESVKNLPNVCYFALSPEDEARDAARHIRDQGKQTPLLLIPRSSLGDRVANAFAQEWQKLGIRLPVCVSAALARGITDQDNAERHQLSQFNLASGFELVGLGEFADAVQNTTRLVQF